MSEHFNPFNEQDDDDEEILPAVEETPAPPEEQSFFERVREILRLDEDEESEDELEAPTRRASIFRRFFARVPGVVSLNRTEEVEEVPTLPEETSAVEQHSFALPFVELAGPLQEEAEAETPLEELSTAPIIEEFTEIVIETSDNEAEPTVMYEVEEVVIAEPEVPTYEDDPVPFIPPAVGRPSTTEVTKEEQPLSQKEAKKLVKKATSQAKKREQKIAADSKKRDKQLSKKLESAKHDNKSLEEQLRERIRAEQAVVPEVVMAAERQPLPPAAQRVEVPIPPTPVETPVETTVDAPIDQVTAAVPKSEQRPEEPHYVPERHDTVPPRQAFEQLTGMEVPRPRTLEQERRFEVKDAASRVPASYTQVQPVDQPQAYAPPVAPQANRSVLMGLGPSTENPVATTPRASANQTYKQAVVSGLVTAVVVLAVLIAWSFFF